MDPQMDSLNDSKSGSKTPVVRGARACTVCRTAKMKCVGAEDGQKQCQRCRRANVECVFEKHRRGRKPGSKLSEASKMLRRLEKGLNSAKMKSQSSDATSPYHTDDPRSANQDGSYSTLHSSDPSYGPSSSHFPKNELPPPNLHSYQDSYAASSNGSRTMDMDDDDEDPDRSDEAFFPAKLIRLENQRNSFFRTILNPEDPPTTAPQRSNSFTPPQNISPAPAGLSDPVAAGIITDADAKMLFDAIFLRLNPFVNLFDPALHTVSYVRSKCPFLFTTLIMAGCKFFKAEKFKECQKLANEFAVRAFAESWKRVEVVQAFACLTYWKDPDDSRTWTFIGYACRMAVELGLNRYVPNPSPTETEFQKLERRNRERTYLVLFVHDRSLSMQTGRNWMLPEDDLVRNCMTWHKAGGPSVRPEDAVIAAFVSLRRIAAETTDIFNSSKGSLTNSNSDINYEVVLSNCNARLTQWDDTWRQEMEKAGGEKFHLSFLTFFRLYVRLFLNSFGLQPSMVPGSRHPPSLLALSTCCTSALDSLRIVSQDFHDIHVLRYGQDSITVMTAYSAVFLLKLLRISSTGHHLSPETANEIHTLISKTADSYQEASSSSHSPVSISASYHARFLRSLVANDIFKARRGERERSDSTNMPIDPRLQGPQPAHGTIQSPTAQVYAHPAPRMQEPQQSFHFPASPHLPAHPHSSPPEHDYQIDVQGRNSIGQAANNGTIYSAGGYAPGVPQHASELDAHYWKNMFIELGFGETVDPNGLPSMIPSNTVARPMPQYMEHTHHQSEHQQHSLPNPQHGMSQMHYQHAMHPTYGH
ncbi:hypothetical protein GALMADRAFT_239209 [Galerina marginata CBS 339.88]|uniref:Zn(2)-C6 fungal-type domain-containing protein n=1 Tax=Galerina marginata (strain CBS 339.88) TaxID=685588 RepID=A0A067TDX5_GALM3|nr:hypothetical protein GALMADRAFT_239209 [Galerina marginata CBS 339.88]